LLPSPQGPDLSFILPPPAPLGCRWLSFDLPLALACLQLARKVAKSPPMSQVSQVSHLLNFFH
ncbi:MAG: hypothetical protein ACJ797_17625, partial [Ktedonobacteraceae bacterium]